MSHRIVRLLAIAISSLLLATPTLSPACGNSGQDTQAQAEQAITWATSLVEWHSRRKVATAEAGDAAVFNLHSRATDELEAARAHFADGLYDEAVAHAKNVSELLDN